METRPRSDRRALIALLTGEGGGVFCGGGQRCTAAIHACVALSARPREPKLLGRPDKRWLCNANIPQRRAGRVPVARLRLVNVVLLKFVACAAASFYSVTRVLYASISHCLLKSLQNCNLDIAPMLTLVAFRQQCRRPLPLHRRDTIAFAFAARRFFREVSL